MKVGDLVEYRGWAKVNDNPPLAIVMEVNGNVSKFHSRIRVMWLGVDVPVQARVFSVDGNRISTWIHPKHFKVVSDDRTQQKQ